MALTSATSNAVVDLSEDNNDYPGIQAAATSTLPTPNATATIDSFERSCDNPECSAPNLISLVPKPVASEFITEPMVIDEPTLINGFTTVFRIDGIGHKMEDLMNDESTANNTKGGENNKPKTVFRVVPNTHAHIVNYVVVDVAGETMRKIKANDPETMNKLLVSQRLSAEQMLKKLIGKALETPTRIEQNPCNAPAAVAVTVPAVIPSPINVSAPAKVPPGITIKLLPTTPSTTKLPMKPAPAMKPSSNQANKTTSSSSTSTTETASTIKQIPKSFAPIFQKTNRNPSQPTTTTAIQSPLRPTTTITAAAGGRIFAATKPVVWQAVTPGKTPSALKTTTPPKIASISNISPPKTVVMPPTTRISTSNLNDSSSQLIQLKSTEVPDVEKSLSLTSITIPPIIDTNYRTQQQMMLKRKHELVSPNAATEPFESRKRLRPRSPLRSPLANYLSKTKDPVPINKKLPMLPKNHKPPPPPPVVHQKPPATMVKGFLIPPEAPSKVTTKPNEVDEVITVPDVITPHKNDTLQIEGEKTTPPTPPVESDDTPVRRKIKPLMGPASKMKALKAIADAKALQNPDAGSSQSKTALITESVNPVKIGETIITRTGSSLKATKEVLEPEETITKPCSVAITDIATKSNNATTTTDSDSDCKSKRSSTRTTLRSSSEKETCEDLDYTPPARKSYFRSTRSSAMMTTPKATILRTIKQKPESTNEPSPLDDLSDSTLLTTPSAPSRVLRVVLPSTKNGIVNNPATSPHPNLKISSVISGGTTLPASMREIDAETTPIIINEDNSEPGIEQLQKELADLRRTVARLTQGKNV